MQALELTKTLFSQEKNMIDMLYQWCNINSGTTHLNGLQRMHQTIKNAFSSVADETITQSLDPIQSIQLSGELVNQTCGDLLFIRKRPHLKRRILLSGHMDTVFAEHHSFQTVREVNKNILNGPGVADMKGGLIVMLHALMAFEQSPYASQLGWDVVINADEEIGSPASRIFFDSIAQNYSAALVYEPAMNVEGIFAKNRRGSGKLTLIATGKSAHAGRAFNEGRNAICYLAEAIVAIHALNGRHKGITINVGQVSGGEALNIVPDKAVVKLDVRISRPEDEHWVREQLNVILQKLKRADYTLTLHGQFERPVKQVNNATVVLFERIQYLGEQLGLHLDWQDSGGCCDGNNFAAHGLAVIDTLGVRGGDIHSDQEFILLNSLIERAALSTLLLADLASGSLEDISAKR